MSKQMKPLIDASITNQEYEDNTNVTLKRLRHSDLDYVIFSYLTSVSLEIRLVI